MSALPFPGQQTANAIADRLERIASDIRAATAELKAANDEADREVRYRFSWSDDVPREISRRTLLDPLAWYQSSPEKLDAILALKVGETWTDPETDEDDASKSICVVTRIQ